MKGGTWEKAERSSDWLRQAESDLRHARHARDDGDYDWAAFASHQAAEKAIKALFQKLNLDAWGHTLILEKHLVRTVTSPHCLAGNRACPPEDCGGPWIYDEFLRSRRSRKGRVSRKWKDRMGTYWDADAFDLDAINANLKREWLSLR